MKILFEGDSIVDGNRGRSEDPNHILGHSFAYIVAAQTGYKYPALKFDYINRGVSGSASVDLKERWKETALAINPDILSLLVGINDVGKFVYGELKSDCYEKNIRELLISSREKNPNIKFILMEPFMLDSGNKTDYDIWFSMIKEKQHAIRKLAKEFDAVLVPLQKAFEEAAVVNGNSYWVWDSVHPTYRGHGLIADMWLSKCSGLLGL